jgi:hypothetical protein
MRDCAIDPAPSDHGAERRGSGGEHSREEWVRANFTQIFGTSPQDLRARGIDPRQYAREHRDEIRRFAQQQRRRGIAVPGGPGPGPGAGAGGPPGRRYGYGGGRSPLRMWGGGAWIGILLALFALRFLLVDSFAGAHAAIFWVLGIGGILLVARVLLFSWLRRRRGTRGRWGEPPGGDQPG